MNGKRMSPFVAYVILTPLMLLIQYVYLGHAKGLDLAVVLACSAGWMIPLPASAVTGFAIGLIQDVFVGRRLGFSALSCSVVSAVMSQVRGFLNPGMPFADPMAAAISTAVGDWVSYLTLRLFRTPVTWQFFIRGVLPYSLIWSFVLTIPVNLMVSGVSGIMAAIWPAKGGRGIGTAGNEPKL